MKQMFIRYLAPVTPQSTEHLLQCIDHGVKQGIQELHLLISSPGGSVLHGISLYNFLKTVPFQTYTYNFGSVDSIGVVLFCAGTKRFCMPHGRFLIHPVQFNLQNTQQYDHKKMLEIVKGIEIDQYNIIKIISDTIQKSPEIVYEDMMDRLTLNPDEALQYGLIDGKRVAPIPNGATVYSISELGISQAQA